MEKSQFTTELENRISDSLRSRKLSYYLAKETVYFINGEEERLYLRDRPNGRPKSKRGRGIPVNELYLKYKSGISMELIVSRFIIDAGGVEMNEEEDIDGYGDRIGAVLISKKHNAEYLREMPHRRILDLALIYQIMFKNGDKLDCTPVTEKLMKRYGLNEEKLYEKAVSYTKKNFRAKAEREGRAIRLTNELGIFGAAALLDSELLDRLAEECGGDLAIIPTSLHEVHAFPLKEINAEKITGVIMGLREISEPEDFLSENYYIYDSTYKKLTLVPVSR